MILAGLLLKLGGCGLYRFSLFIPGLFSPLTYFFLSFLIISMVISGVICCAQSDLKRLIAYSSVVHMTAVGVLFLLDSSSALSSSLILIVLHGVSSPLMFFIVGHIYTSFGTRLLVNIRSLKSFYPVLYLGIIVGFYLTVPVPPSLAFLGEVYLFGSLLKFGSIAAFLSGLYLFIAIIFNLLWLTPFFGDAKFSSPIEALSIKFISSSMALFGLLSLFMVNTIFI